MHSRPNESRMNKRHLLVPLVLTLAGCTVTPEYTAPAEGRVARLRLATSFAMAEVFKMDSSECVSSKYALIALLGSVFGGKTPEQSLGMPLTAVGLSSDDYPPGQVTVKENSVTEVHIDADQMFGIRMFNTTHYAVGNSTCEFNFAFRPQAGNDYEAVFHFAPRGCRVSLSRIVSQPGREAFRVNEPFKRMENRCEG